MTMSLKSAGPRQGRVLLRIAVVLVVLGLAPTASAQTVEPTRSEPTPSSAEACRNITRTAYAYVSPHYPANRRAVLTLTLAVCTTPDQYGYDQITSHSCQTTTRTLRPRVVKHGGLYSPIDEDYADIYTRGIRCVADDSRAFASVGQDWKQNRASRPALFACPTVRIVYLSGSGAIFDSVAHDDLETRGNYNGNYSWRCPVWR